MAVTFFRQRRAGPEVLVEDAVAARIPHLFQSNGYPLWTAGSLPIGAGRPDLVVVSCEPRVYALARVEMPTAQILAYLRAVGRARLATIVERLGGSESTIARCLERLRGVDAVSESADVYCLSPEWRDVLPEIVTIEVKVTDWRKAVCQAGRNRVFAHKSFIALPRHLAERVHQEATLVQLGIGVLAVSHDNEVTILRPATRHRPRVWTYYYQLAHILANCAMGVRNGVCCPS